MKKSNNIFSLRHIASSLVMLMALVWLTVSLPFVNESKQLTKKMERTTSPASSSDDGSMSNSSEEKSESGTSLLSEYLHEAPVIEHHFITLSSFYKCHPSDLYFAYHPDLIIPPPKA